MPRFERMIRFLRTKVVWTVHSPFFSRVLLFLSPKPLYFHENSDSYQENRKKPGKNTKRSKTCHWQYRVCTNPTSIDFSLFFFHFLPIFDKKTVCRRIWTASFKLGPFLLILKRGRRRISHFSCSGIGFGCLTVGHFAIFLKTPYPFLSNYGCLTV